MPPLRIGTLGAARIAPAAIVRPAREVDEVEVAAVAARDRARAEKFATKHGIPKVHGTYDALLGDPDIDAIYNPLPNGLHAEWTDAGARTRASTCCARSRSPPTPPRPRQVARGRRGAPASC